LWRRIVCRYCVGKAASREKASKHLANASQQEQHAQARHELHAVDLKRLGQTDQLF